MRNNISNNLFIQRLTYYKLIIIKFMFLTLIFYNINNGVEVFDIKTNSKMILGIAVIVALLIVGWVAVDVTHQDLPNYTINNTTVNDSANNTTVNATDNATSNSTNSTST